ncbi:hypothetical protein KM043_000061, partial [Ampulex compressa]
MGVELGYAQPARHCDTVTTSTPPGCRTRRQPTGGGE